MAYKEAALSANTSRELYRYPWIWPHLLSLDAPAVAVVWQLLSIRVSHARVASVVTAVLALVIWLIYVGDRILDSYQTDQNSQEPLRHRFYKAHRKAFLPPFLGVLLLTAWISYAELGLRMRRDGLLLAALVGLYLVVVHALQGGAKGWFPKELAVAILFGAGTLMPVAIRAQQIPLWFLPAFLLFFLVLWMNALLIEYSEWLTLREGKEGRPHGSTIVLGEHLAAFAIGVGVLALAAMAVPFFAPARLILLAETVIAFAMGGIGLHWRRIPAQAVGIAADMALLAPLFVLLLR
jgi:hypothetical protein